MRSFSRFFFFPFFLPLLLLACSILGGRTNTQAVDLEVSLPPQGNTFVIGDDITLFVENKSDSQVWLPNDGNLKVFIVDSNDAILSEIQNKVDNFGSDIILDRNGEATSVTVFLVFPDLQTKETTIRLKVTIEGRLWVDGKQTDQVVRGAVFVDLHR